MNIKNLFKKKIKSKISNMFGYIDSGNVYTNNHVSIVHRACRICTGRPLLLTEEKQLKNIERVITKGHESVLEHSNIIMYLIVPEKNIFDLLEVTEHFKYLNYKTVNENNNIKMLIGGSIRGYKHVFRNIKNLNNPVLENIKQELYIASNKEYFIDFIEAGIMDYNQFKRERIAEVDQETGELIEEFTIDNIVNNDHKTFTIHSIDNIKLVYDSIKDLGGFTYDDLLDLCTITIEFKNMSRIITQQLTRHRAAITQESQRYVDYSEAKFIDPTQFKPNKYDKNATYEIRIGDDIHYVTTAGLAENLLMPIYPQLRAQGLDKEDARGFTLQNIESKLIMTFTFRGLIKFLELRTDKAAQPEIRETAIELELVFKCFVEIMIGDIYKYLLPKYSLQEADYDYSQIDETIGEVDSDNMELSEEEHDLEKIRKRWADENNYDPEPEEVPKDEIIKKIPKIELKSKRLEKF